jgi:hypothetical protein
MTCPHCGADASAGQKFCPKCSRLVDSPLLHIKQQLDAARAEIRKDLNAMRVKTGLPPQPAPQLRVTVSAPSYAPSPAPPPPPPPPPPPSSAPYKYAPHPSQTPALTRPPAEIPRETILRSQQRNQRKKNKQRDEGTTRAQHTGTTHRFDPVAAAKKAAEEAKAAAAAGPVPERFKRPLSFSVLALLDLFAALALGYSALQLTLLYAEPRPPMIELHRILAGGGGLLFLLTMFGMLKMHPFGRFFQRILVLPVALWVPFGTIYAIATWLYLGTTTTKLYFSGRSPRSLHGTELAAWRTHEKAAPVFGFLLFAFGFIPGLAYATFIGSTAPFVLEEASHQFPQLLGYLTAPSGSATGGVDTVSQAAVEPGGTGTPAPSASSTDGAPIGDSSSIAVVQIKRLQQAQTAYASMNEGYYDRLECILTPTMCIRNGDERRQVVILDPEFGPPQRHGYTFLHNLHGEPAVRSETASASSMRGFSYRAIPSIESGDQVAYCGDETGLICSFDAKTADGGNFGHCPAVCRPIE